MPSSPRSPAPSSILSPTPPSPSSPAPTLSPPPSPYRYTPSELGVFSSSPSLKPYKATLLPLWRFRTPAMAHTSAAAIWACFLAYEAADDFVGMDMARKYLQMGMTRAKRYANYKGGRKFLGVGEGEEGDVKGVVKNRKAVGKSEDHAGKADKEEASRIFKEVWERARTHEGYVARKDAFLAAQRRGDKERKRDGVGEGGPVQKRRKRDTVKVEGE
ncbi:hypothetical protein MMC27_007431 [Xylographa pallens]|nr:hypothetical protein [Xylographa pallens]